MKFAVFKLIKLLAYCIIVLFFDRKYLSGHFFARSSGGYVWAFRAIWTRNILRLAPPCPWPSDFRCTISNPKNITFHPDDINNFQSPGTYFQCTLAKIHLGRGSYIAPNVGIITSNHDLKDLDQHGAGRDVIIGDGCWIGMNSVLLPGVVLGPNTIVAAGSVVTKGFHSGHVILAGSPAKVLRNLSDERSST